MLCAQIQNIMLKSLTECSDSEQVFLVGLAYMQLISQEHSSKSLVGGDQMLI